MLDHDITVCRFVIIQVHFPELTSFYISPVSITNISAVFNFHININGDYPVIICYKGCLYPISLQRGILESTVILISSNYALVHQSLSRNNTYTLESPNYDRNREHLAWSCQSSATI